MKTLSLFFFLSLVLSASAKADQIFPDISSATQQALERQYDSIFPTYAEACSGSQMLPLDGGGGGLAGHELLYIRGLCRDEKSSYPRLRDCTSQDQEPAVAVSVDQIFKNVNWVAIEGRDFIFRGEVSSQQPLTVQDREEAIDKAVARGFFKNITAHAEYLKGMPAQESQERQLARASLGTSYALNFYRHLLCARVPLVSSQLEKMKSYLNALNEKYFVGGEVYNWSVLKNNCSHVAHNALAAAGVWGTLRVDAPMPLALLNMAAPPNEWALTAHHASHFADNVWTAYNKPYLRKNLLENGVLPSAAGGLLEIIPIHRTQNGIANTHTQFHMLSLPEVGVFNMMMKSLLKNPANKDLKTNLLQARQQLDAQLRAKQSLTEIENIFSQSGREMPKDFPLFYEKYFSALQAQSTVLDQQIARFLADGG
jgi:hypothetical protein